jgi:sensor histidine kinase regulating citrate/malate metabolism
MQFLILEPFVHSRLFDDIGGVPLGCLMRSICDLYRAYVLPIVGVVIVVALVGWYTLVITADYLFELLKKSLFPKDSR